MFTKADIIVIEGRIRAAMPAIWLWLKARASERSTWKGVAILVGALGFHELSGQVDQVADALMIAGVISGAGMIAHPTAPEPEATSDPHP